jgi:hypothetical protein
LGVKKSIIELAAGVVNCDLWTVWRTATLWKGSSHGRRSSRGVGKNPQIPLGDAKTAQLMERLERWSAKGSAKGTPSFETTFSAKKNLRR